MRGSILKCFLVAFCIAFVNCQSSCPQGWKKFQNKKCYYLEKEFYSYERARELCSSYGGILATIKDEDQQRFLNDYIFNSSATDVDVWIGATRVSRTSFQWEDRTALDYDNWAPGSPSNVDGRDCAVIQSRLSQSRLSEGGWKDISCNKVNYCVCESQPAWSLGELSTIVAEMIKNPVPIGFVYAQLPGKPDPYTLWPMVEWKEISSEFAGKFFRVVGGGAEAFGKTQAADSPRLTRVNRTELCGRYMTTTSASVIPGTFSYKLLGGSFVPGNNHDHQHLSFYVSNPEIRPVNTAVRIWIRQS